MSPEPEAVEALIQLAGEGAFGLSIVTASETRSSRWSVRTTEGPIKVEDDRLPSVVLWPQDVDTDFSQGIGALMEIARAVDGVTPETPPYDELAISHAPGSAPTAPAMNTGPLHASSGSTGEMAHAEIEVRVLGPVEIVGTARPFARAWAQELVVYLAFHSRGAASDKWATALWPDRLMAPASLHSTASAARRSLGTSKSGEDHLPRSHGRLALGPGVRSDWAHFVELAGTEDPELWRLALTLIRGRPFEGLRSPDWTLLEGVVATMEAVVVDLSLRLAENSLSMGRSDGAEWAARQGLKVSAYDERLYRILLRCADQVGNPAGVETVMQELIQLVADDVEPFDAVHPETFDLYRQLSRRSTPIRGR